MLIWGILIMLSLVITIILVMPFLTPTLAGNSTGTNTTPHIQDKKLLSKLHQAIAKNDQQFKDQLIDDATYQSTRAELARQLIRFDQTDETLPPKQTSLALKYGLMAMIAVLPIAAFILYNQMGAPKYPAQPTGAYQSPIAQYSAYLENHLDDRDAWLALARELIAAQQYPQATIAYARAWHDKNPTAANKELALEYAVHLVNMNDGNVPDEARFLYDGLYADHVKDPVVLYMKGLQDFQIGKTTQADIYWQELLALDENKTEWQNAITNAKQN